MQLINLILFILVIVTGFIIITLIQKEDIKQPTIVIPNKTLRKNTYWGKNKKYSIEAKKEYYLTILVIIFLVEILLIHWFAK